LYAAQQSKLREVQAQYQGFISQANQNLQKALGKEVDIQDILSSQTSSAATRAGVRPGQFNAGDLSRERQNLKQEVARLKDQISATADTFNKNIPGSVNKLEDLTRKLGATESALDGVEKGLQSLPGLLESQINTVIGEIANKTQQVAARGQAAGSTAANLVSSTPQELVQLSSTFNLLNNTLNGQITTIQQSQAAQQAYYQALQSGATYQEAMGAAQQAFASQTKNAISMFDELIQFSGMEGPEVSNMRADLLENFARSQGAGLENNAYFKSLIDMMRQDPGEDPQVKVLKDIYNELKQQRTDVAGVQQNQIRDDQASIMNTVFNGFIDKLNSVELKFDQAQLQAIGLGLSRPTQATGATTLEKGGVVYASKGKYVNYQPKGTDTVPAMLTPGEFVVNAQATKNNLGLLRAINSSAGSGKTFSKGGVVYAAGGGLSAADLKSLSDSADAVYQTNSSSAFGRTAANQALQIIDPPPKVQAANGFFKSVSDFMRKVVSKAPSLKGTSFYELAKMDALPGLKITGKTLAKYLPALSIAFGAYDGYNADENKTKRNKWVNTVLGAVSGSGTTMGDVGATSITGSATGGNFLQVGLTTASYTALGVPPPIAALLAAGSITTQEAYALWNEQKEYANTQQKTRDMENSARQSEGLLLTGFSPPERTWILERARIEDEINRLKGRQQSEKYERLIKARQTHEAAREQVFSQRTGDDITSFGRLLGYEDKTIRARSDEAIDKAWQAQLTYVQTERTRKKTEARNRIETQKELEKERNRESELAIQRRKEEEKAAEDRRRLGLPANATEDQVGRLSKIRGSEKQDLNQILGASEKKDGKGERISNFEKYKVANGIAGKYLASPIYPKDHPVYQSPEFINAIKERQIETAEIARIKTSTFDPAGPYAQSALTDISTEERIKAEEAWTENRNEQIKAAFERLHKANLVIMDTNLNDPNEQQKLQYAEMVATRKKEQRQEKVAAFRKREREKNLAPNIQRMQMAAYRATSQARNPRQLMGLRENFKKNAIAQGIIDPGLDDITNVKRITSYGGGALANFLYGQNAINPALRPRQASRGGVIYANQGMLVPYEPKGTDTVPAMLTPGEFVVNRAATQANLPLLKAINNGTQGYSNGGKVAYKSKGGSVSYYNDGGLAGTAEVGESSMQFTNSLASATQAITNFGNVVNTLKTAFQQLANNSNTQQNQTAQNQGGGVNINGITQFTNRIQSLITQLQSLSQIPTKITLTGTHTVNVNIVGAESIQSLNPEMQAFVEQRISQSLYEFNERTFLV